MLGIHFELIFEVFLRCLDDFFEFDVLFWPPKKGCETTMEKRSKKCRFWRAQDPKRELNVHFRTDTQKMYHKGPPKAPKMESKWVQKRLKAITEGV